MIYYFATVSFILGTIIGSFINCLVWRMHKEESILGRSYCPKCNKQISWYDNIPVFSYIFLKGKCRHCKQKISMQYPLVEIVTGVLFSSVLLLNLHIFLSQPSLRFTISMLNLVDYFMILDFNFFVHLLRDFFFVSVMVVIFIFDLKWYLILDKVTIPSFIIIFLINFFLGFSLYSLLIASAVGGGFFLLQFVVSKGRWIGGGDIRLGALMGAMFSWPMILLAIFLAYIIGSIISIFLVLFSKKKWDSEIPLGIFLTSASIITMFWGEQILTWYLGIF